MEGADNQGARDQSRPVRQNMYQDYRTRFRLSPCERQPWEDSNEEDKENQGLKTQGQHPPQCRYCHNYNYSLCRHSENPKPQDGKETKAANPPAKNSSTLPVEQARLSKCLLSISSSIRFCHRTRRDEYEILTIRNEQKIGAEDLEYLLFPNDQIIRTTCIIYAAWHFYYFYLKTSLFGNDQCVGFLIYRFLSCFRPGQVEIFRNLIFNL